MEFKEFYDKYLKDDKEKTCAERLKLIEKVWNVCKTIHQYNSSERSVQPQVMEGDSQYSGWISISDRLPKRGEDVLCISEDGVHEAEFLSKKNWSQPYYGQDVGYSFKNVTYWMPMPLPKNSSLSHNVAGEPRR